jgi:hypothetical protein
LCPSFYPGCVNCNQQEPLYVCPVNLQLWSCWSLFLSFAWTRSTVVNWLSFSKNWCNIYYFLIPLVGLFLSVHLCWLCAGAGAGGQGTWLWHLVDCGI